MPTLAMRFDAPMQSWGLRSRGVLRETAQEPTKSGVIGLIAAAIGINRTDDAALAEIAGLRLAVRVDREGTVERDYQTAMGVPTTQGTGHRTVVSERYYLADAVFLVVVEGPESLLLRVMHAVQKPHWPLCFGRRAFVPARPLLGRNPQVRSGTAEEQLTGHPWLAVGPRPPETLRTVTECDPGLQGAQLRQDQPISFAPGRRQFATRTVHIGQVPLTGEMQNTGAPSCI